MEPRHVDSIQVNDGEDFGVDGRGAFYDGVGAAARRRPETTFCRCSPLVAMEPPTGDDGASRVHRLDVFRSMPSVDHDHGVAGQYAATRRSTASNPAPTPRLRRLPLEIDNWRWAGPIFVRAGKALPVTRPRSSCV
jgi:glucose-6-phosphate 1-dehydrogenase